MKSPQPLAALMAAFLATTIAVLPLSAEEHALHTFKRQQLTGTYFSEGANAGDINADGHADVVYGPYWFAGPDFTRKHEIYAPKPQPVEGYADNFFNWVYDFNADGAPDILVVGFPGTPGYVYENPGPAGLAKRWKKHAVVKSVANESPQFLDLVGDKRPELLCTQGGAFGFVTVNWDRPFETWPFHKISDQAAPDRFGHGLGAGDISGDGRMDIIAANGWFEQPADKPLDSPWKFHPVSFSNAYGGAEMYAYDVDGDGDNDVITSLAAHDFGLAWYEQVRSNPNTEPTFRMRLIMGNKPAQNRYGVVFSEPHSLALVDMDGDGLKDIVTGKTYYSHHKQSPMWDAGAVVYWFRLTRSAAGVDWVPHKIDGEAGIGRQVSIADLNNDKLLDVVVGGMKGAHVLLHSKKAVSQEEFRQAQPKPVNAAEEPVQRGPAPKIDSQTGKVVGAVEGEDLKILNVSAGKTSVQAMQGFKADRWSGGRQLFWSGAKPGDRLELQLVAAETSQPVEIKAAFTMAGDYAIVQCTLDGKPLGRPIDFYNYPEVITTGELTLGTTALPPGPHKLALIITGANPAAAPAHLVGLDYIRLHPARNE